MRILITFGPSYEPIDGARRLTNMSTGRLGVALADAFVDAGWRVHALGGEGATCRPSRADGDLGTFGTNDDLGAQLEVLGRRWHFDAVLHAAALCDYRVSRVIDGSGRVVKSQKIATRDGEVRLELAPATKVLPRLRAWFPTAQIVGWKYELAGTRDEAFARAWRQIRECATDACVLNGAAYGPGFAVCRRDGRQVAVPCAVTLAAELIRWLGVPAPSTTDRCAEMGGRPLPMRHTAALLSAAGVAA